MSGDAEYEARAKKMQEDIDALASKIKSEGLRPEPPDGYVWRVNRDQLGRDIPHPLIVAEEEERKAKREAREAEEAAANGE